MAKLNVIRRYLGLQFHIQSEEDFNGIYNEVLDGVMMKGANLWVLGIAMIMACIGLTTNSISAVIGAMLISPLMGPIIGFSFGLAINDKNLRRRGIQNWLVMTMVSLLAATLFFLLNPFDNSTEMLEAFKKASIFDIALAFFGGMAGFIGILKKEGVKIIAGVAVATACMPPVCTAAYGLAHGDFSIFIGGFYFYFINCLFIGWATFLLTRYLKIQKIDNNKNLSKKSIVLWDVLIVLMMIPGIYIAYQKWKMEEGKTAPLTEKQKIELLEKRIERLEATQKMMK